MKRALNRIRGFTLIELIVVIAVIGILASIAVVGLNRYQGTARDTQRTSSAAVIAEALEKYYDANGEYPSCAALTSAGLITNTLTGIEAGTIVAPQAASGTTNSLRCTSAGNILTINGVDFFEYQGDGSAACNGSSSCLSYTLKYKDESNGQIMTIESRRNTAIATSGNIINLGATPIPFSSIMLAWSPVPNAVNYTIQRSSTNTSFPSDGTFSSTIASSNSATITGLTPGTTYFFRVAPNASTGQGNWSNVVTTATASIATPGSSSAVASSTNPSTQLNYSWGTVANAASYTVDFSACSTFCSGVTTRAGLTTTTTSVTGLSAGTRLYFRVKAVAPDDTSNDSTTATAITFVPAPTGLATTTNSSTQVTATWTAVPLATSYRIEYSPSSSFSPIFSTTSTVTNRAIGALSQGQNWRFRVYALIGTVSSTASTVDSSVTPIDTPALPTYAGPAFFIHGQYYPLNYTTYCPAGTSVFNGNFMSIFVDTGARFYHEFGFMDYWLLGGQTTANVQYYGRYQCSTAFATSGVTGDSYNIIQVRR